MDNSTTCITDGCDRARHCRKLCKMHYLRAWRAGQTAPLPRLTAEQRFWKGVSKTDTCWEWTAGKNSDGYGSIYVDGKHTKTHRYSYELVNGPIPEGMVIDHICHNRGCVNPDHLRLATVKQNSENLSGPRVSNVNSGVRGVHRKRNWWTARLGHNGEQIRLGTYATIEEAEAVVIEARRRIFTHSQD